MSRWDALLAAFLVAVGMMVYAADLDNTLFFDDEFLITQNIYISPVSVENVSKWFTENSFAGGGRLSEYYRPLLIASFAGNYALHGDEPFGYFLFNNILHAITGVGVFLLVLLLFKRRWLAFFTALIYIVHPIQSENIAFAAGRGDLLGNFFILAALLTWMYGIQKGRPFFVYLYSSLLLILALLSHETAMVMPFLAIILYVSFMTRETIWVSIRDALTKVIPHLLLVAGYFILRLTVLNFRDFLNFGNSDPSSLYTQDIFVRLFTFMPVLGEYVKMFFFPTEIHLRFTYPIYDSVLRLPVWSIMMVLVGLLALLFYLYTKERSEQKLERKKEKDPHQDISDFRLWFFALGWFFAALVPSTGIIPTNAIIQDHRIALALIALAILVLVYGARGLQYLRDKGLAYARYVALAVLILWISWLSWISVQRATIWGDHEALFVESLQYEPDSVAAHNMLGITYMRKQRYEEAKERFIEAISLGSVSPRPFFNLGHLYRISGLGTESMSEYLFKEAIAREDSHWLANLNLAQIYMRQGRPEAIDQLQKLHALRPRDANVIYNIAAMYDFLGDDVEALPWIDKGLMLVQGHPDDTKRFEELRSKISSDLTQ